MLICSMVLQVSTMIGLMQLSPCLLQNGGTLLRRLPLTAVIKVGVPATQTGSLQRVLSAAAYNCLGTAALATADVKEPTCTSCSANHFD